jgi:energy-coupling factor transport system ATP-binding protein
VAVTIDGLVHRYPNGVAAVRGVSLRIEAGESLALVGQNGSGKTTLIKHLNGLLRPTAGRVLLGDADTAQEPINRLAATVGFVFQNPDDQLFERSVDREVRFGPRNLGLAPTEVNERVERALAAVGLEADRATNPYDLGISMRKLVALAGVLAMDPLVMVLDEPTTGQDGPGIARIGAIVDSFRASGRTVIAITHDMEFAARHFGRIVVLREGAVIADGAPEQIFSGQGHSVLASTGLALPPAARIAARLGLHGILSAEALLAAIARDAARA